MKKMAVLTLAFCCMMLWVAQPASAAEEAGPGWGIWEGIGRFINLFILFGVIFYFTREPLKNFFDQRKQQIQQDIQESRRIREDAQQRLATMEEKMKSLDQELVGLRSESEKEARMEYRRIVEQSERDAEKIMAAAEREIQGLIRTARKQLREDAAELSVRLAKERLQSEFTAADQRRVVDRFFLSIDPAARRESS
ncbi:MAG: ATP synthase F0 subunit B [Acidobacteria bacterium]|nr:ATP synthase F0 subunit B [Acidobacteriota bacterium]